MFVTYILTSITAQDPQSSDMRHIRLTMSAFPLVIRSSPFPNNLLYED